jgi:hypothetical protein
VELSLLPWVPKAKFDFHVAEDARVHGETSRSLSTILDEVRAGNTVTQQLADKLAPLDQMRPDLQAQVDDRRFRARLRGSLVTAAKGAGWCFGLIAMVAGVAAVSPAFLNKLTWLLSLFYLGSGGTPGGQAG